MSMSGPSEGAILRPVFCFFVLCLLEQGVTDQAYYGTKLTTREPHNIYIALELYLPPPRAGVVCFRRRAALVVWAGCFERTKQDTLFPTIKIINKIYWAACDLSWILKH